MNSIKKQLAITVIALISSIGSEAHAQPNVQVGSGSGNGDISRDQTQAEKLVDAQINDLKSIEESIDDLREKIRSLSQITIPASNIPDQAIWDTLTDSGRLTIQAFDAHLEAGIQDSVKSLSDFEIKIKSRMVKLNALRAEAPFYDSRGMTKEFKKRVKDIANDLRVEVSDAFSNVLSLLIDRIFQHNSYSVRTGPTDVFFYKCDTALCVDQIAFKALAYSKLIDDLASERVFNPLDRNHLTLRFYFNGVQVTAYEKRMRLLARRLSGFKHQLAKSSFNRIIEINQAEILRINPN